jgi:cell wall-associated NlpC family hydrolase
VPSYEDMLNKPYSDFGNGPDSYNCWGVIREYHRREGFEIPDLNSVYQQVGLPSEQEARAEIIRQCEAGFDRVEDRRAGDVAQFNVLAGHVHVGVLIDRFHFLHVILDGTVVVQRLDHPYWQQRFEGFYRWKKKSG